MYHEEHTAELLNSAAAELDDGIFIKWDGDPEDVRFKVYFDEDETPFDIVDRGSEFEIHFNEPGTRVFHYEAWAVDPRGIVEQLVDLLRERV